MAKNFRSAWVQALFLALLAIGLYWSSLSFDYTMDDALVTTKNSLVATLSPGLESNLSEGSGLSLLLRPFSETLYGNTGFGSQNDNLYRPLLLVSMILNKYWNSGFEPAGFHLGNVLLYALCVLVVYFFFRQLFRENSVPPFLAFFASLLFLALPSHLEVVCNIKHREEILACLFSLSAWIFRSSPLSALLFLMGLFSKESAILIFPCLMTYEWVRFSRKRTYPHWYFWILAIVVYLGLRYLALGNLAGGQNTLLFFNSSETIFTRFAVASSLFFRYYVWDQLFALQTDPAFSSRIYLLNRSYPSLTDGLAALTWLGLLGSSFWYTIRTRNLFSFTCFAFFLSSLLTMNLIPIGTAGAFRLIFTPSVFLAGALILGSWSSCNRIVKAMPSLRPLGIVVFFAAFLIVSLYFKRDLKLMPAWRNDGNLYSYSAEVGKTNPLSYYAAGQYYERNGSMKEKVEFYGKALAILTPLANRPELFDERTLDLFSVVATETAYTLAKSDSSQAIIDANLAIQQFERLRALRNGAIDSNEVSAYYVKALALSYLGKKEDAKTECRKGLELAEHSGVRALLTNLETN